MLFFPKKKNKKIRKHCLRTTENSKFFLDTCPTNKIVLDPPLIQQSLRPDNKKIINITNFELIQSFGYIRSLVMSLPCVLRTQLKKLSLLKTEKSNTHTESIKTETWPTPHLSNGLLFIYFMKYFSLNTNTLQVIMNNFKI